MTTGSNYSDFSSFSATFLVIFNQFGSVFSFFFKKWEGWSEVCWVLYKSQNLPLSKMDGSDEEEENDKTKITQWPVAVELSTSRLICCFTMKRAPRLSNNYNLWELPGLQSTVIQCSTTDKQPGSHDEGEEVWQKEAVHSWFIHTVLARRVEEREEEKLSETTRRAAFCLEGACPAHSGEYAAEAAGESITRPDQCSPSRFSTAP